MASVDKLYEEWKKDYDSRSKDLEDAYGYADEVLKMIDNKIEQADEYGKDVVDSNKPNTNKNQIEEIAKIKEDLVMKISHIRAEMKENIETKHENYMNAISMDKTAKSRLTAKDRDINKIDYIQYKIKPAKLTNDMKEFNKLKSNPEAFASYTGSMVSERKKELKKQISHYNEIKESTCEKIKNESNVAYVDVSKIKLNINTVAVTNLKSIKSLDTHAKHEKVMIRRNTQRDFNLGKKIEKLDMNTIELKADIRVSTADKEKVVKKKVSPDQNNENAEIIKRQKEASSFNRENPDKFSTSQSTESDKENKNKSGEKQTVRPK